MNSFSLSTYVATRDLCSTLGRSLHPIACTPGYISNVADSHITYRRRRQFPSWSLPAHSWDHCYFVVTTRFFLSKKRNLTWQARWGFWVSVYMRFISNESSLVIFVVVSSSALSWRRTKSSTCRRRIEKLPTTNTLVDNGSNFGAQGNLLCLYQPPTCDFGLWRPGRKDT